MTVLYTGGIRMRPCTHQILIQKHCNTNIGCPEMYFYIKMYLYQKQIRKHYGEVTGSGLGGKRACTIFFTLYCDLILLIHTFTINYHSIKYNTLENSCSANFELIFSET